MNSDTANIKPSGICVVIDDKAKLGPDTGDPIDDILNQIHDAEIPCLIYEKLPSENERSNFHSAAFILLDWELGEQPHPADPEMVFAMGGDELRRQREDDNIAFLTSLREVCFTPVFIFSHLAPEGIKDRLRKANLFGESDDRSFIMVRHKLQLKRSEDNPGEPLLDAVTAWIAANPAIYVLSRWKNAVGQSQNRLFWDFYDQDHNWPSVLWETYQGEGDDPEHGLVDILLRNLRARLFPLSLNPELVAPPSASPPDRATTQAVIEASMIVPDERLPKSQYGCGDIFKGSKQRYWINIRCDCDCIAREGNAPDAIILFLLEARPIKDAEFLESFDPERLGLIQKNASNHILFPLGGKALRVRFGDICQVRVGDLKERGANRIGRLTQPYITQIRQRFALHLQREGLPRIPNAAIPVLDNTENV